MKKSTKVELVSAIAMLLVAAIMMTSASFAWYTLSTTPEVTGVEMQLGVSKNFEIARANTGLSTERTNIPEVTSNDALNQYAWGAKVTEFDATTGGITYGIHVATSGEKNASGVDFNGGEYCQINYDETGRTNGKYTSLSAAMSSIASGVALYSANISYLDETYNKNIAVGYAVWLRANQEITSMTAIVTKSGIYGYYANTPTTTFSSIEVGGNAYDCKDMVDVTVDLYTAYPGEASGWASQEAAYTLESGVEKAVTISANSPVLAVIKVVLEGDNVFANAYTSGNALCFKGFEVGFSSPQISE